MAILPQHVEFIGTAFLPRSIEWAFDKHWSAKVEYLYLNFGSVSVNALIVSPIATGGGAYSQNINTSADLTAQIARARNNYKF